ncbi:HNH endonuclease signature motif containing protein [Corynebacterium aquatimens]|uniref:HNH nuclease domain-containing protein n=1 Tax=Corynebacterium aquatimens TaxID=1190508 RepID=A0A931E3K5_9CORY|nr:HNH endonuclease signature motif containing protein [Corynebacterium aquatimens]MBG6121863.1 hypothetical protein [Corynebacterium aquatimens]WJY65599.1 hypothetical protein CAQUA_04430 [Corynebacterium aquatimens]
MNFTQLIDTLKGSGLDALESFDMSAALNAGIKPSTAKAWQAVHEAYYGTTRARKQQRIAREAARVSGKTLEQLALIERHLARETDNARRRELRLELLRADGGYDALNRRAKTLIPEEEATPQDSFRTTASRGGKRSVYITADEHFIADLEHAMRAYSKAMFAARDTQGDEAGGGVFVPNSRQMLTAFVAFIRGGLPTSSAPPPGAADHGGAGAPRSECSCGGECVCSAPPRAGAFCSCGKCTCDGTIPVAVPRPLLLVPVHAHLRVLSGGGDEVSLVMTDGTEISGAEYLERFFADPSYGFEAALFHPEEGAVNLYDVERYANTKQADLARAVTPVCPVPGCKVPAQYCQIHHITAWSKGGHTNMSNLTVLCPYHNQINNDDPDTPTGGWRHAGSVRTFSSAPMWVSPTGHAVPNPHKAYRRGAMWSLFGDPRRRGAGPTYRGTPRGTSSGNDPP